MATATISAIKPVDLKTLLDMHKGPFAAQSDEEKISILRAIYKEVYSISAVLNKPYLEKIEGMIEKLCQRQQKHTRK